MASKQCRNLENSLESIRSSLTDLIHMLQFIYKYVYPDQKYSSMSQINTFLNSLSNSLVKIFNHYTKNRYNRFKCNLPCTANFLRAKILRIGNMIYHISRHLHISINYCNIGTEIEIHMQKIVGRSRMGISLILSETSPRLKIFRKFKFA